MIVWRVAVLSCIALLGLVGNSLAIVVLVKHPNVLGESHRLILNQSIIDLLAAAMLLLSRGNIEVAIGQRIYFRDNWLYHFLCKTWGADTFLWGIMVTSTYNLVFLTLERCLKIAFPFWYRKHVTPTVLKFFIVFVWVFGNLFELLFWFQTYEINLADQTCRESESAFNGVQYFFIGIAALTVESFLPMICLIVFYGLMLRAIRKQRKVMEMMNTPLEAQQGSTSNTANSEESKCSAKLHTSQTVRGIDEGVATVSLKVSQANKNSENNVNTKSMANKYKSSEMKVLKTVLVVCTGFFVCFLPMLIMYFLVPVLSTEDLFFWFSVAYMVAFMNCGINPMIYVGMHDGLRKNFMQTIQFWK